ncbi:uncharacterized protein LACBIDRAFT_332631 [Laccaria bicolor S238N-H82]|uniref:Predicted protein n=1 Tax=Laccaria bicolor (strain S238N-H82 / ATCC MYA-4686) TaxID=486041 RepID=B0DTE2_LACBS|nr:uncharacterized protein LACBIDRAFT_332631 [Laccaria bicolor S238N-H82]EDR02098.1 predicted protein [Laccaria bicolor S238N-H82]|eukprot:XP_001887255.1 predicted protein [Laccaria bicolor S238N-H82]
MWSYAQGLPGLCHGFMIWMFLGARARSFRPTHLEQSQPVSQASLILPILSSALPTPKRRITCHVRRLRVHGIITGSSNTWHAPMGVTWSPAFLEEGVILFPDNRTQIRLRFWAACDLFFTNMRHLLELAIRRGMKFIIAIPFEALPRFHQQEKPSLADLTKRTYDTGFQETPLTYSKGGSAFMDQYLGKLADILRRPHARAKADTPNFLNFKLCKAIHVNFPFEPLLLDF